jgi:hypothetical protein
VLLLLLLLFCCCCCDLATLLELSVARQLSTASPGPVAALLTVPLLLLLRLLLCSVLAAFSDHLLPPSLPLLPATSYQTTWQLTPADGMLQHHLLTRRLSIRWLA